MTVLSWVGAVVGGGLFALGLANLCRQVEQLTHHVNRLLEAEDQRATAGKQAHVRVVRRELRSFAEEQLGQHANREARS